MNITCRPYSAHPGFSEDFLRVRDFLVRVNGNGLSQYDFPWGRWEWAIGHPYLDEGSLGRIGIWEDAGRIVALATYESKPGSVYFCLDPGYRFLVPELLSYAARELSVDGKVRVLVPDTDAEFQAAASRMGFRRSGEGEPTSVHEVGPHSTNYHLPEGFTVKTLEGGYDIRKYHRVMWRGFDHPGEPPETEEALRSRMKMLCGGPHADLSLRIAVIAPGGEYASFCGMWYEPGTENALVEPVATDPAWRRMGLGRAAVLEGVRRCALRGAKRAFVGSDQPFYHRIGFRPLPRSTWWILEDIRTLDRGAGHPVGVHRARCLVM